MKTKHIVFQNKLTYKMNIGRKNLNIYREQAQQHTIVYFYHVYLVTKMSTKTRHEFRKQAT